MSRVIVTQPKRRTYKKQYVRRQRIPLPVVSGKGAYTKYTARPRRQRASASSSSSIPWGSAAGGIIGSMIGGPPGGAIGSAIGGVAQGLIKHFTGVGDYTIEANTLMGANFSPPELINKSHRGVCLRHREFITDITASSAFDLTAYDINPGLSTTFPWLAGVANNFEQYAITGMIFEYKSLSADYTTASSAALGYVVMATQYNPLQPQFQDKIHMENYEFANSAKPSESFIHPIECKKALTPTDPLYVRTGPVEDNADQRLYDLGKFQIATGGNTGSGVLGELWCTYEVCFYKPKLVDADDDVLSAHWRLSTVVGGGSLGTLQVPDDDNTIDIIFTPTSMTFPATMNHGKFLITWNCVGASTAVTAPVVTAASGCSIPLDFAGHTIGQFSTPNAGGTSTSMTWQAVVIISDYSAVVSVAGGTLNASISSCDLHIAQMWI